MDDIPCLHCTKFFTPRNKDQNYCSKPTCQRARRAAWQKNKMATDPEYKAGQQLSNEKWKRNTPQYWREYRERNPKKAERNRNLQRIRNKRRKNKSEQVASSEAVIAKMDASNRRSVGFSGQYWLVPLIAKMDASKVFIHFVSDG